MKSLLINGCYDEDTLQTLIALGARKFAFDLRARSPNLVPFKQLEKLLQKLSGLDVVLIFESDRSSTVDSFLDLLKNVSCNLVLEFRDQQDPYYYDYFKRPFFWMFNPSADWRRILLCDHLRGVLLPVCHQKIYQDLPELWRVVESRNLEVYLHAFGIDEASRLAGHHEINLSLDLSRELEIGFRKIDQERLKKMKIWSNLNEDTSF